MTKDSIREYLRRFCADPNRGCTVDIWIRDLSGCSKEHFYKIIGGANFSTELQKKLSESIESWVSGRVTLLEKQGYRYIGQPAREAPKIRRNFRIFIGPEGPELSVGVANRRDYLGDLK